MKKILLVVVFLYLGVVIVNFKTLVSYFWQTFLVEEWGKTEIKMRMDVVEKINSSFPNLTNSSLPIDAMKARYYIREGNFDTLIYFIENSKKANPYIGAAENIYAQIFFNKGEYDSSYKYSRLAFEKIPNNQLHGSVYINSLIMLDSLQIATEIFDSIKYKTPAHYNSFLKSLFELRDTIYIYQILNESNKFNEGLDLELIENIKQVQKLKSYTNFLESEGYSQMAEIDFKEGFIEGSKNNYRRAINKNPFNYINYENLGIILFKEYDDSLNVSKKMFLKSINLNKKSSISYYYLGVISVAQKDLENSCKYLKKSKDLGNNDALLIYKNLNCF